MCRASSAYICTLIYVITREFSKLLSSPEENTFDLEIVGRVSFLRPNFAEKTCMFFQRHVSSLNISFSTSYHLLGIHLTTSLNQYSGIFVRLQTQHIS